MKNKAIKVLSCLAVVALVGGVVIACNNNVSAESMETKISTDDVETTSTPVQSTSVPSTPTRTTTPASTTQDMGNSDLDIPTFLRRKNK